jgi:hypothetical protein
MQTKSFMFLAVTLLGSLVCVANSGDPEPSETIRRNEVYGTIIHAQSKASMKDVNVTAYVDSKKMKIQQSDNEGNYSFDVSKPGVYKFVFEKSGYKKIVKDNIFIKSDEAFLLNIEMFEMPEMDLFPSLFNFL